MTSSPFDKPALLALLGLELLYLLLVWSIGDRAHLGVSLLFIACIAFMLIEEPPQPLQRPGPMLQCLGAILMLACAGSCIYLWQQHLESTEKQPLRLLPMLMLGAVLLWRGGLIAIARQRDKLLGLFFLGGPHLLVWWLGIPALLAVWSAQTASYLLWYLGADVRVQGAIISLSGKAVLVTPECAGSDTITYLLGIALLTLLLFPPPRKGFVPVLLMALAVGFITNVVRIAALVVLYSGDNPTRFNYWHSSEGAQLFGVLAILAFAALYSLLQHRWRQPTML